MNQHPLRKPLEQLQTELDRVPPPVAADSLLEVISMLTEHSFTVGSVTINYAEEPPSGPPLVLLHGLADRWQAFLPILPTLAARWHVYAVDCRGHGKSSRTPGHYQAKDYFADLRAFLLHQLPQPALLLGHSSGGSLALALAAELPEHVRGIMG